MPAAPLQDRAVNGALHILKRQVSDAFYKHYTLMLAGTPAPERSDTAQRPRGRLSSPLRAAPRRRSPPSCSSTLFCRNEDFLLTRMYAAKWHTHSRLADAISDYRPAFPIVLIGNQIVDLVRVPTRSDLPVLRDSVVRFSCCIFAPLWIDPIADSLSRVQVVVSAAAGTPPGSRWRTARVLPRRRSGRPGRPRGSS
jgi:hypothetical protein